MIPKRLIRVVQIGLCQEFEDFWKKAVDLHPDWEHITYVNRANPDGFPLTRDSWDDCSSGAQLAGLIRMEELYQRGGIYIDSDVEPYRPFDVLLNLPAFAAWEDGRVVPDAVMGFERYHPAALECVTKAVASVRLGAWESGPGITTRVLPGRLDVLLFPPGSWYPYHWSQKERRSEDHKSENPWAFGAHHWAGSWQLPKP